MNFLQIMTTFADDEAIRCDGQVTTYAELLRDVATWRTALTDADITAGSVVALDAPQAAQSCAALLALVQLGALIVPHTGLSPQTLAAHVQIAQVEFLVRSENPAGTRRTGVVADHPLIERLRTESTPGLILFSSGTSGRPKASVLNIARILRRYGAPRKAQRTMTFLNLDHIGGVNTMLHTFSQGGTAVTITERTPDRVFAAIAAAQVQVLPTTPTFLTMTLISGAHLRHDWSSLQLITYGTEPMPEATLSRVREQLPDVRLKQTYGLSELGILPTRSKDDGSLWMQLGGKDFAYDIRDGVLWIKSEMAMLGYLNAPAPFDEHGYFNTQDLVEVDGDYVRVLGRTSELINVAGEKVYPSEVESVLLEMPNVAEATVSGRPNPVTGMVVKATVQVIEPEDAAALRRRLQAFCEGRLAPYKVPVVVEVTVRAMHSERFKKARVPA